MKGKSVTMKCFQKEIELPPQKRGFHLITHYILQAIPEIKQINTGMLQVFIKHTSASLTINENADNSVLIDFESHMNVLVPEDANYFTHTLEGPDDMTSHVKASLMGTSVQIPVTKGKLNMGIWQGIYLCEHRNRPRPRVVVVTAFGV